jgi:predicted dehydrogenase
VPEKLRIGFVGAGFMGQLAHIRSYARLTDECELVALAEPRRRTAEQVAERYGIDRVYRDHRELVEAEALDGIVASQHFTHHAALLPDLYPAVRHLFTEKPLALAPATADRLVALARAAGCTHMVGYHRRSDPATREAKRVVDEWKSSGELGPLRYVRICYPSGDWIDNAQTALIDAGDERPALAGEEQPPDFVTDDESRYALWSGANELVHPLNLLRHLLGERYRLERAHVSGRLYAFESESGVPAAIEMTPYRTTTGWDEEALVAFDRGCVRLRPAPSLADGRAGTLEIRRDADRSSATLAPLDPMEAQAADFLRVCRGEADPPTDAAEAAEDLHLVVETVRARLTDPRARELLRVERDAQARVWQERLSSLSR